MLRIAQDPTFSAVRDLLRRRGGIFHFASFVLPPPKRDAVAAVFAFHFLLRDAIDRSDHTGDSIDARFELFGRRLDEIYSGRLELPNPPFRDTAQHTLAAIAQTINRYEIPRQLFLDLAEARRMELTVQRYATWNALLRYCDQAAGALGRIVGCILGLRHSDAARQLATLAVAIRFTQMLCRIKADHTSGRIWLPLEDLARFGYSERQLAASEVNDAGRALMQHEIARAHQLYRDGAEAICWLADDGSRVAASIVAVTQATGLKEIERCGGDVFARSISPGIARQLARLGSIWRLARREDKEPMPNF